MHFYKKLAANTLYQVVARIASSGATFLITFFVAHHFGIGEYGEFAKVTAFVSIFYFFVDLGLNAIFLQKEDTQLHFKDLFYTRLLTATGIVIVSNIIGFLLPYNSLTGIGFSPLARFGIFIFSFTILTEALVYSASVIFQRRLIYRRFMIATIIGSLATVILVGFVGLLQLPLIFVFAGFLLGAIIEAGFMLFYTEEKLLPFFIDTKFVKHLAFGSFPVALMLVFNLLYFRIDMLLLSVFKPSADVAVYDMAYKIFDFLLALPLFLSNVLYPKIIEDEKNSRIVKAIWVRYALAFGFLGILVAIPVWFVSPFIFAFIRPEFVKAAIPLNILLLSLPVFFATNILQWILLSKKRQTVLAWIYGILMVGNILLNFSFIPQYSYVASAIITGASEVIVGIVMIGILVLM